MKYPQHRINWAESRWYTVEEMMTKRIECEKCGGRASEIHHIDSSFRGKRNNDANNLIALCRPCHESVHSHNNYATREQLHNRVDLILKQKECLNTNPQK